MRLPRHSHFKAAYASDEELAEMMADLYPDAKPDNSVPIEGYTPEAERIDAVFDAVMVLVETVAQIAGGKRIRPTRAPRPETAAQKLERRKRLEKVYALADKMTGGR